MHRLANFILPSRLNEVIERAHKEIKHKTLLKQQIITINFNFKPKCN